MSSDAPLSFVCQQCKQPLQLDASLVDLAPSAYDMVAASVPHSQARTATNDLTRLPAPAAVKAAWQRSQAPKSSSSPRSSSGTTPSRSAGKTRSTAGAMVPGESFVLLQDSIIRNIPQNPPPAAPSTPKTSAATKQRNSTPTSASDPPNGPPALPATPTPLSHHLRSTLRLYSLLSSRTELDHPLCAECTHVLLSSLNKQLEETKKERDGYIAFEKEAKKEKDREASDATGKQQIEKRIASLREDERVAIQELRQAEQEHQKLQEELLALEREEKELEEEEAEFWRAHNSTLLEASQQVAQLRSVRAAYTADSLTLERLERTNVYNDTFCIGQDGIFGTINGLRLGRGGNVTIEWPEINAAWGQALLLLSTLARKLNFNFEGYRLVPLGSFSRIERTQGDKASYELYGSGDLHIGRILHNRRFDLAMVAFLDCLRQVIEFVKDRDQSVEFPHQIVKDRIGETSVKLQFSQEEAWTRALRHVLLALKILLRWATTN